VDGSAASVTGSDFSAGQNHAFHQAAKPKENVFRFPVQGADRNIEAEGGHGVPPLQN